MAAAGITVSDIIEFLQGGGLSKEPDILVLGAARQSVRSIVLGASADRHALEQAARLKEALLIVCDPLPSHGASLLRWDDPVGAKVTALIAGRIPLLLAPDACWTQVGGFEDCLAGAVGLADTVSLTPGRPASQQKLVTFVPADSVDRVQKAASEAGAGIIGNYTECAFRSAGQGTFLPMAGAQPAIGNVGNLERVDEIRLEMIVPENVGAQVAAAVKAAHPYEEVACDLYPLDNWVASMGRGRFGRLSEAFSFDAFLERVRASLPSCGNQQPRYFQRPQGLIRTVATACGQDASGALFRQAQENGADIFLTGISSPIDRMIAYDAPTAFLEVGYAPSLAPGLKALADSLRRQFGNAALDVQVSS